MITLDRIEGKLNAIMKRQGQDREAISSWISGVEQSQGKLLAALHETQQGILELTDAIKAAFKEQRAALEAHGDVESQRWEWLRECLQMMADRIVNNQTELDAKVMATGNGLADELHKLHEQVLNLRPPVEYPIAKEYGNKVVLFWPDKMLTLVSKPKRKKVRR